MEAATLRIDKHGIQDFTIKNLAADLGFSEAALYRHFKSKNDLMLELVEYFIFEMKERIGFIVLKENITQTEKLQEIFHSQLKTFLEKPALVSIIFSEGIFQFDKRLSQKVIDIMKFMQNHINVIVKKGQEEGIYRKIIGPETVSTIILGSMRMTVLKWKLSGHKSNLIKDGNMVLSGIIKMMEN